MTHLSFFDNFTSVTPKEVSLTQVADIIRHDTRLQAATTAYRLTHDKHVKQGTPTFAIACILHGGRKKSNVTSLTGLSMVDFDHIFSDDKPPEQRDLSAIRQKIESDPHTVMCYATISGNGLRVIYGYEVPPELVKPPGAGAAPSDTPLTDNHLRRFEAATTAAFMCGNDYYVRLCGLESDSQCKNLTRLCGLAHDPQVFLNVSATPFTQDEISQFMSAHNTVTKHERLLQRIEGYYEKVIRPRLEKEQVVYASGSHNQYVMRVGYMLAEKAYPKTAALEWACRRFSDYDGTHQVITSCYNNVRPVKQKPVADNEPKYASVDDIKSFLDSRIRFRHNVITSRVEYLDISSDGDAEGGEQWQNITDRVVNSLWAEMSASQRVNSNDIFRVIDSDYVPLYHPFRDYLDGLPPGTAGSWAIHQLASTIRVRGDDAQQKVWEKYLTKWLVGMVASWLDDSVVNNVILVLIGEQGVYKTTWFNYLLPPPLRRYFYTKTNANRMGKDDLLVLAQYGLVCCEEIDTMRAAELNQLKAAVTMTSIDERAAYARYHEHRAHIASFCATGNNVQFLSDATGNRRWLPFAVDSIVSPRERPFDYVGIYSEALRLYRSGYRYWFSREEIIELNTHNRHFETPRLEVEQVALFFRRPTEGEQGIFMTATRILQRISEGISSKLSPVSVGRAMIDLGFERVRFQRIWGYRVIERTADEIRSLQSLMAHHAESTAEGV